MPFIGLDWRSPGDSWIRTEFGWKRIAEIRSTSFAQIAQQIKRNLSPRSVTPRALSRKGSSGDSADGDGDGELVQAAIRQANYFSAPLINYRVNEFNINAAALLTIQVPLEEREKHLADASRMPCKLQCCCH